jgi:DNA-binding NarL/FixJ family response regulator
MDIQMPVKSGIDATNEMKIIFLTTFENDKYVMGGIRAGAQFSCIRNGRA